MAERTPPIVDEAAYLTRRNILLHQCSLERATTLGVRDVLRAYTCESSDIRRALGHQIALEVLANVYRQNVEEQVDDILNFAYRYYSEEFVDQFDLLPINQRLTELGLPLRDKQESQFDSR